MSTPEGIPSRFEPLFLFHNLQPSEVKAWKVPDPLSSMGAISHLTTFATVK